MDKKISELTTALTIVDTDVGILVSNGTDYQFAFSTLLQFISSGIALGAQISFGTILPQNNTGKNGDVFINTNSGSFAQKSNNVWVIMYTPTAGGGAANGAILFGNGVPAVSTGDNQDTYIDVLTGIFYKKADGTWAQVFSMQTGPAGVKGDKGDTGVTGINGKTILSGTTNPSNTNGGDGDYYINTNTHNLFGPKTAGIWGSGIALVQDVDKEYVDAQDQAYQLLAENPESIVQSATYRFATDAEKAIWNGKQNAIGYTPANDGDVMHLSGGADQTTYRNTGFFGFVQFSGGTYYTRMSGSQWGSIANSNLIDLNNNSGADILLKALAGAISLTSKNGTTTDTINFLAGVITRLSDGKNVIWQADNVSALTNDAGYATSTAVSTAISTAINNLVNSAPGSLDTLKELADALGDDPNYAATITSLLAAKLDQAAGDARYAQKTGTISQLAAASSAAYKARVTDATGVGGGMVFAALPSLIHPSFSSGCEIVNTTTGFKQTLQPATNGADIDVYMPANPGTLALIGDASLTPTTVKTAPYTATVNDFIPVSTAGGNVVITLPTAPADKATIGIKMILQAGTNIVTINAGGADVFNKTGGSTSLTLKLVNQGITLQYAAGIWYVLNDDLPLGGLDARYQPITPGVSMILATSHADMITKLSGNQFIAVLADETNVDDYGVLNQPATYTYINGVLNKLSQRLDA